VKEKMVIVAAIAVLFVGAAVISRRIVQAIRSGAFEGYPGGPTNTVYRSTNPVQFWIVMSMFTAVAIIMVLLAVLSTVRLLQYGQ